MLRPLFSLNRANIFTQVEEHTEHLVDCIPDNEIIDLQPLFFQFTLDTITFLLFGKSMNSLQATASQEAEFSKAFRIAQDYLFRRGRLGDLYWTIGGKEFRENCAIVHRFIDGAIQEALSMEHDKASDVHSFLDALIQETRDPKVLRDQLLNVMLAGRDTTACCLTWTL
jgi:cytochrome P450